MVNYIRPIKYSRFSRDVVGVQAVFHHIENFNWKEYLIRHKIEYPYSTDSFIATFGKYLVKCKIDVNVWFKLYDELMGFYRHNCNDTLYRAAKLKLIVHSGFVIIITFENKVIWVKELTHYRGEDHVTKKYFTNDPFDLTIKRILSTHKIKEIQRLT